MPLHLAAQALALGQAGHDLQAIAEDHAVGPVGVVLVELGLGVGVGQAVEVGEKVDLLAVLLRRRARCRVPRLKAPEVVNEDFGVDLFLNIEGRRLHHEAGPILPVLAAPDELGVKVGITAALFVLQPGGLPGVLHPHRLLLVLPHHRLIFGRGDVLARRLVVGEGFDSQGWFRAFGHFLLFRGAGARNNICFGINELIAQPHRVLAAIKDRVDTDDAIFYTVINSERKALTQ